MAINKVCIWARPVDLFIVNEDKSEDNNIFHNSDKPVWLIDSDSHNSPLSLPNDSDPDVKSEESPEEENLKTIYPLVRSVVFNDTHLHDVTIGAIKLNLEDSSDIQNNHIHNTDGAHMLNSQRVIPNDLANNKKVGEYGVISGW